MSIKAYLEGEVNCWSDETDAFSKPAKGFIQEVEDSKEGDQVNANVGHQGDGRGGSRGGRLHNILSWTRNKVKTFVKNVGE